MVCSPLSNIMVKIKQLVSQVRAQCIEGSLDRSVQGIAYDARQVRPGMAFVAVPNGDGEILESFYTALDRGASVIVCEPNLLHSRSATKIQVGDARAVLAALAAAWHGHPSRRLNVIGIAGDHPLNGAFAALTRQFLEAAGMRTGLISSWRTELGERILPAGLQPLEALEVQQMLAGMVQGGCVACVIEMDMLAIARQSYSEVHFHQMIYHVARPGTTPRSKNGALGKRIRQARLTALTGGLNALNKVWQLESDTGAWPGSAQLPEVRLSRSDEQQLRFRTSRLELHRSGSNVQFSVPGGTFDAELKLVGRSNVTQALSAMAVASCLGMTRVQMSHAMQQLQPAVGFRQVINRGNPFLVVVDSAATPVALKDVLIDLQEICAGKIILVTGGEGGADPAWRRLMGCVAAEHSHYTVVTSNNPGRESPETIASEVCQGFLKKRQRGFHLELQRELAIGDAIALAQPGDVVLITGKGPATFQHQGAAMIPFDDAQRAQEALESLQHHTQALVS